MTATLTLAAAARRCSVDGLDADRPLAQEGGISACRPHAEIEVRARVRGRREPAIGRTWEVADERVVAGSADDGVAPLATGQEVGAPPADQSVAAKPADDHVVAGPTEPEIVALGERQEVGAGTAVDYVVPGTREHFVIASAGEDPYKRIALPEYFRRLAGITVARSGLVSCPAPAHRDRHPSCSVGAEAAQVHSFVSKQG